MNEIAFDPSISPEMNEKIGAKLRSLESREGVRILFAIESGSRAWGFPSPDSDYDVRFVYARPVDWYLSIGMRRDVIEVPIMGLLDINGWDIRKALGLLLKPNPVLLEWLSSPVRYIWNESVCELMINFSMKVAHGPACLRHYLHLGERTWNVNIEGKERVRLKKYFYIVRPAMALRWIRMHPESPPPMNFQELLQGIDLTDDLVTELEALLFRKGRSGELGEASRIAVIDDFIGSEFAWARGAAKGRKAGRNDLRDEADELFRSLIKQTPERSDASQRL